MEGEGWGRRGLWGGMEGRKLRALHDHHVQHPEWTQ